MFLALNLTTFVEILLIGCLHNTNLKFIYIYVINEFVHRNEVLRDRPCIRKYSTPTSVMNFAIEIK